MNIEWAHVDICYKMVMIEVSFCSSPGLLAHREKYGHSLSSYPIVSHCEGKLL